MGLLDHATSRIITQYTPGLAYDHRTSNLVLVWSSSEGRNRFAEFPDGGSSLGCDRQLSGFPLWLRHCTNEVLAAILTPDGNGTPFPLVSHVKRFAVNGQTQWGYAALGSPSVICDPIAGLQCEVYATNWTQWKEIVNWRFCVDATGFCGFSLPWSERPNSPGETDFAVALSGRRGDGSGRILEAVVGTDRNIWWRSKASVQTSFGGWMGPLGPQSFTAPSLAYSWISDTYFLSYSQGY